MADSDGSWSSRPLPADFEAELGPDHLASDTTNPRELLGVGSSFVQNVNSMLGGEHGWNQQNSFSGQTFLAPDTRQSTIDQSYDQEYAPTYTDPQAQYCMIPSQPAQKTDFDNPTHAYSRSASGCADAPSISSSETHNDIGPDNENATEDAGPKPRTRSRRGQRSQPRDQVELPDFFYAHKPITYASYRYDCSRAYSDFHGFIRNSLKKHKSRKHFDLEQISEDQYQQAIQIKISTVGRPMTLGEKHKKHWKLVRRILFGTDLQIPIPECENKGFHDTFKARRTAGEKVYIANAQASSLECTTNNGSNPVTDSSYFSIQPSATARQFPRLELSPSPACEQHQTPSPTSHHSNEFAHVDTGHHLMVPSPTSSSGRGTILRKDIESSFRKLAWIEGRLADGCIPSSHFSQAKYAVGQIKAHADRLYDIVRKPQSTSLWQPPPQAAHLTFGDIASMPEQYAPFDQQIFRRSARLASDNHCRTPGGSSDQSGHSVAWSNTPSCS